MWLAQLVAHNLRPFCYALACAVSIRRMPPLYWRPQESSAAWECPSRRQRAGGGRRLLYRTYAGNASDQGVLAACLQGLAELHAALDAGEGRTTPGQRTVVRDGGFWSPQLELDLDEAGYHSLISLPLAHGAAEQALAMAAGRGAMKRLGGTLGDVRAARMRTSVGALDRTLVVVESEELLRGQKRGIAVALRKAKAELRKLERLGSSGRLSRSQVERRTRTALAREYLSRFVVWTISVSLTK